MHRQICIATMLLSVGLATGATQADTVTHRVWDHPNGGLAPPTYLLRLLAPDQAWISWIWR